MRIEEVSQGRTHELVSIHKEKPRMTSLLNGKLPSRLYDIVGATREGDDATSILLSDLKRTVGTLHITDEHLIKVTDRVQDCRQVLLGIVSIDDDRDLFRYIHRAKLRN